MTINAHLKEFYGKPVQEYQHGKPFNALTTAPRLSLDYDTYSNGKKWIDLLEDYLLVQDASKTTHLVVGAAEVFEGEAESSMTVDALIANRHKLPKLEALFIGDITFDECELSWINAGNFSALWGNFQNLMALAIRGYPGTLGAISMPNLESFTIQCSGMSKENVREILAADMPNLTRLELWIGTDDYGGDSDPGDWAPLLNGDLFPKLKHLGLRNCSYGDELAQEVANAKILNRIDTLDLSFGTLSDLGAAALYNSALIRKLKHLDLHYHYMSDFMVGRFSGVDLPIPSDQQTQPEPWEPATSVPAQPSQPQKIGFMAKLFGAKQAAPVEIQTPAPPSKPVEEDEPALVDYHKVAFIPAGQFGPTVNVDDQQEDDEGYRYVAVGE